MWGEVFIFIFFFDTRVEVNLISTFLLSYSIELFFNLNFGD
jgi:hypothetical protein